MRIAICSGLYPTPEDPLIFGGAEVFVRQLAESLVERGDDVVIIRASLTGIRKTENVNGVVVEFIPVRNLFPPFQAKKSALMHMAWHFVDDNLRADGSVRQILEAFKPDLLHSNTLNGLSTDVWRTARDLEIPIVHTLHDYYLVCPRCSRFRDGKACSHTCGSCRLLTPNRRRRTELVDTVVSVSQRTLNIHREHGIFSDTDHHIVRNVPHAKIEFSPQVQPDGPLILGYLGRFSEEKGVRLLAEAVALLPKNAVRFLMAGHASEDEQAFLRSLAPQADMEFVGFVSPTDFYSKVQVVAVPSVWDEPGALALVDALAAGRPVIGTRFGGIPEIIDDDVTGWITQPDAVSIAAALQRLIDKPDMLTTAHETLFAKRLEKRNFSNLVDEYRAIYATLDA